MLDPLLRPAIDRSLSAVAVKAVKLGATATGVTIAGFGIGVLAMGALALDAPIVALVLILINRLFDGLDGAVARIDGATDLGGYYDIVFDFIIYSGLVFAFALGRPETALAAAFLIFSFVGTGTSFLAYAILAQKHGVTTEKRGSKAFYYLGGLTEGTETVMMFIAICLFPDAFVWIAIVFGAACWLTTTSRIMIARSTFGQRAPAG